jgi:hypothetical protein
MTSSEGGGGQKGPSFGAFVISLDFELHWGVRDRFPVDGSYRNNLLGAREAIPAMLELFESFDIGATWATVGFLFARSPREMEAFAPRSKPRYANPALSPYGEPVGEGEADDPLHFAPSLIELIRGFPRQEIGTHTFSHYYCLEPGQDAESFQADLSSAVAIAADRGLRLESIAIPRNQFNPGYRSLLAQAGLTCYRGNQSAWMYRPAAGVRAGLAGRAMRFLDSYAPVEAALTRWEDVPGPDGLCNVPASLFLRPYAGRALESLKHRRIARCLRRAATTGSIFHLWWHPHNFGTHTRENLAFLRGILEEFDRLRERHGIMSLSMREVTHHVGRAGLDR